MVLNSSLQPPESHVGRPPLPEQASTTAAKVDALYFGLLGMTFFFIALIYGLLLYFGIKYRRGSKADRSKPRLDQPHDRGALDRHPAGALGLLLRLGEPSLLRTLQPARDAAEVFVVGKHWMWYLQHPEGSARRMSFTSRWAARSS
jgi:cytochrome c oxidase subunit 2